MPNDDWKQKLAQVQRELGRRSSGLPVDKAGFITQGSPPPVEAPTRWLHDGNPGATRGCDHFSHKVEN